MFLFSLLKHVISIYSSYKVMVFIMTFLFKRTVPVCTVVKSSPCCLLPFHLLVSLLIPSSQSPFCSHGLYKYALRCVYMCTHILRAVHERTGDSSLFQGSQGRASRAGKELNKTQETDNIYKTLSSITSTPQVPLSFLQII